MTRPFGILRRAMRRMLRGRADARLLESERRYTQAVEQSINGFVIRNPEGQLRLVNEAYCRMTGYSREELMKLKARDMVVDQTVLTKVALLQPGESTTIETLMKCKGGVLREVQYVTQRLSNGDLQSVLLDISDRKAMERARDESERRYTDLVEQAADSIWLRNPAGQMVYVNEASCQMLGYTRAELLATGSGDLIHASDPGTAAYLDALKPGETLRIERIMRHKDGYPIPVEASARRLKDASIQVISHDISERKAIEAARDESERRYAELVDQALEGIMVRRPDGRLLFANETFCRMLGYARAELLELNIRDIVHPEDAETIAQISRLQTGAHLQLQKRMLRKGGGVIHVEVSAKRLQSGDVQTTVQDVSERKEAEARFRAMVEGSPTAMLMVSREGRIAFTNPEAERLFGYGRGELEGQSVDVLVPMPLRGTHTDRRATFYHDPRARRMGAGRDLYGLRKDGGQVPVEIGLNPTATAEGDFVLASIIDISERKRAEERFRAMVEGAPNAMIMADSRGIIALANPQAEKLFGYSREELMGQPVEMLVPLKVRPGHPAQRDAYNRAPQMRAMGAGRELFGLRKDGREVPVEIGLNPIVTAEGSFVLASIIDITERKQAEAREREYMDELRHMSQQLLDAQETERRAIARELHDEVGQSLTATRLTLRDLEQQAAGGPLAPRLGDASNIVADLLGKVRQMSLDLHPSVLDDLGLAAALRWCVRTRAGNSGLDVQFELPPELPRFSGMAEITVFRVFQEALSNVLKHAGAMSVRVTLRHADGSLELHLKDDGCGFDAEAARRHALSGKSLGMVGMEERVRLAGGKIRVESAPGRGTEIEVSLPVKARDAERMPE